MAASININAQLIVTIIDVVLLKKKGKKII